MTQFLKLIGLSQHNSLGNLPLQFFTVAVLFNHVTTADFLFEKEFSLIVRAAVMTQMPQSPAAGKRFGNSLITAAADNTARIAAANINGERYCTSLFIKALYPNIFETQHFAVFCLTLGAKAYIKQKINKVFYQRTRPKLIHARRARQSARVRTLACNSM